MGHQLLQAAGCRQETALVSGVGQPAPRDGQRDAFDTILKGVVQV